MQEKKCRDPIQAASQVNELEGEQHPFRPNSLALLLVLTEPLHGHPPQGGEGL